MIHIPTHLYSKTNLFEIEISEATSTPLETFAVMAAQAIITRPFAVMAAQAIITRPFDDVSTLVIY